jgi:hypothetical protein
MATGISIHQTWSNKIRLLLYIILLEHL